MSHAAQHGFLLRLPVSVKAQAADLAKAEGISLNHLVSLAVAEKLARLSARTQQQSLPPRRDPNHPYRIPAISQQSAA